MDALSGFLDGPRARDAFLLKARLEPPWAMQIQDEAPLTVVVVTSGSAVVGFEDDDPTALAAGDVAIIRGPDPYVVADAVDSPIDVVIHPGQVCTTPDGESLTDAMTLGVRTWGNSSTGRDVMLVGTYQTDGEVSRPLVEALPRLVLLRAGSWEAPIVDLLAAEIEREGPAQDVVLDRLLDLLLVTALRAAFAGPNLEAPAWFRAQDDPVVGPAVRLVQDDPARAWTVASLAAEVGVSRANLARRFTDLVGEPPMTFLTRWRLALAADLLLDDGATVTSVSRAVGYGSPFTFSTAFKRQYGCNPRAHRDRERARRAEGSLAIGRG